MTRLANLQTELDEEDESLLPVDANLDNALMTITDSDGMSLDPGE